ncbi:uncharacterized protein [Equus przewalskii]|uniref:Uncharacterized protein isoform X2 n=1 Tax=Equus przewalskii TaxID=9798 RepID=A0ABM4P9A0_EQUPR
MQWCKSWGRLPWTDFGCWGGKAQQPVGGGETGRQTAPTFRAQTQEVHLRQPLHSCRGQAVDPSSALDLGEAGSDRDPGWESPGMPADPTPGCLQELNPTITSSSGEPGSSEFKDLARREERGQAEPTTQRPCQLPSRSQRGRKLTQGAPGPSGLPSQSLPEPQDPPEGLGWSLGQERAELQKLLRIEIPQSEREEDPQEQKEETPQGQKGEAPPGENKEVPRSQREKTHQGQSGELSQVLRVEVSEGQRWEAPQGENKEASQGQRGNHPKCQRNGALVEPTKETPQGREAKILQSAEDGGLTSQGWEGAQRKASTQPREEGDSLGVPGDFCRSLGEQMPKPGERERPGSRGRSAQLMQRKTNGQRPESAPAAGEQRAARDGARAPLPSLRPPARPLPPGPGAVMLAAPGPGGPDQQERDPHGLQHPGGGRGPAAQELGEARGLPAGGCAGLSGAPGERRSGEEAPKASKAAWPAPPGREQAAASVSAAQQETALQRLLELHREARRRRRQDREQQHLRVLERLRIARNRHCRVHPLGPPPSPAPLLPQARPPGGRRWGHNQLAPAGAGPSWGRPGSL